MAKVYARRIKKGSRSRGTRGYAIGFASHPYSLGAQTSRTRGIRRTSTMTGITEKANFGRFHSNAFVGSRKSLHISPKMTHAKRGSHKFKANGK